MKAFKSLLILAFLACFLTSNAQDSKKKNLRYGLYVDYGISLMNQDGKIKKSKLSGDLQNNFFSYHIGPQIKYYFVSMELLYTRKNIGFSNTFEDIVTPSETITQDHHYVHEIRGWTVPLLLNWNASPSFDVQIGPYAFLGSTKQFLDDVTITKVGNGATDTSTSSNEIKERINGYGYIIDLAAKTNHVNFGIRYNQSLKNLNFNNLLPNTHEAKDSNVRPVVISFFLSSWF